MNRGGLWWCLLVIETIAALGYMTFLYVLSDAPLPSFLIIPVYNIDKLYHVGAYAVLGVLVAQAFLRMTNSFFWGAWLGAMIASLYGVSDEWHQSFVMGRSSSVADIFADYIGACLGAISWVLWRKKTGASLVLTDKTKS